MPDPGYGPNGERLDPSGAISWSANAPPVVTLPQDAFQFIRPLGVQTIPFIDQDDDEAFRFIYLGGV